MKAQVSSNGHVKAKIGVSAEIEPHRDEDNLDIYLTDLDPRTGIREAYVCESGHGELCVRIRIAGGDYKTVCITSKQVRCCGMSQPIRFDPLDGSNRCPNNGDLIDPTDPDDVS